MQTQTRSIVSKLGAAVLLLSLVAACSKGGGGSTPQSGVPSVRSNSPVDRSIDVPVNASMSATFSERMDPASLNDASFTLFRLQGGAPAGQIKGTIIYANFTAVLWPSVILRTNTAYVARITVEAKNLAGTALRADHTWSFTTGDTVEPGRPVNLGRAGDFAILAKSGISTVPTSAVTGNLGLSPAAASFITGFALSMHASNVYATSSQVTGNVYAADYAPPTPTNMTTSVLDMETAFTDAAGRAPGVTELGGGNIGGMTLAPGVYKWGTGLLIPTDVTLTGNATDVWVFQIAQSLTMASATNVVLAGGALPKNVFWQVAGLVDVGTTARLNGIVLCATAIALQTGATVNGRLLAQTAVSLDASTVVQPAQ
jgi:hypothetical protein